MFRLNIRLSDRSILIHNDMLFLPTTSVYCKWLGRVLGRLEFPNPRRHQKHLEPRPSSAARYRFLTINIRTGS